MIDQRSLNMKRRTFLIWRMVLIVPFIIGTIGYLEEGFSFLQSIYGSFCFYFVSVYSTVSNPLLEIARWTAPISLFTGLIWSVRSLMYTFRNIYVSLDRHATVIYCDESRLDDANILQGNIEKSFIEVYAGNKTTKFYHDVNSQIIMFGNDLENLNFLSKHEKELMFKNVYVNITDIDTSLLDSSNYKFFNSTEVTAAMFWSKYPIRESFVKADKKLEIAIIGSNEMGEKIILSALLHNIFSLDQEITYHVFGAQEHLRFILGDNGLMNNDKLIFHQGSWLDNRALMKRMNRIICTDQDYDTVEALMHICPDVQLYYYSDHNKDINKYFLKKNFHNFGSNQEIYTKENVVSDKLYSFAKALNYMTVTGKPIDVEEDSEKMDEEWRKLNGLLQASYKACVDYHLQYFGKDFFNEITPELLDIGVRLEHVRWCRFYFINGWSYGEVPEGANYDINKGLHRNLRPYDEINDYGKELRTRIVKYMMERSKMNE